MQSNVHERKVSMLERYSVLLEQLKQQEKSLLSYEKRSKEIARILTDREVDEMNPILLPSIYDPLRNSAIRTFTLAKVRPMNLKIYG